MNTYKTIFYSLILALAPLADARDNVFYFACGYIEQDETNDLKDLLFTPNTNSLKHNLKSSITASTFNDDGHNLLHLAIKIGSPSIVETLLTLTDDSGQQIFNASNKTRPSVLEPQSAKNMANNYLTYYNQQGNRHVSQPAILTRQRAVNRYLKIIDMLYPHEQHETTYIIPSTTHLNTASQNY